IARASPADTFVVSQTADIAPPAAGTISRAFDFAPSFLDDSDVPVDLTVQAFGFAIDEAGNCAAAASDTEQSAACVDFRGQRIAGAPPETQPTTAVAGRSFRLPTGAVVPDLRPDAPRRRLYLSNWAANRVEIFDLATGAFANP